VEKVVDLASQALDIVFRDAQPSLRQVPDDADAYKMFETLNHRGLETSQADLVKNYLFGKSGDRMAEVQHRWSYMTGALEALDDDDSTITFMRHALVVQRGYLSASDVFDTVQDIARAGPSAISFAAHLERLASVYVATFNPENERWNGYPDSIRSAIEVFNLLNIKPMRALLLAAAEKMEKVEAAKAFGHLVSVGVRLLIAATIRSGAVEGPVSTAAKEVFEGQIHTAKQLKSQLRSLTPSDSQFKEAFERMRVSSAKHARYYLRSLEMTALAEPEPWFIPQNDQRLINLEHVLPEKPEGNWPQFTEDDVAQYAKRLGNLTLLRASDNSYQRSAPFSEKKVVYAESPYRLTSQLARYDEWNVQAIVERQKVLAELAIPTWPGV